MAGLILSVKSAGWKVGEGGPRLGERERVEGKYNLEFQISLNGSVNQTESK